LLEVLSAVDGLDPNGGTRGGAPPLHGRQRVRDLR
jgi:hypothetical protein